MKRITEYLENQEHSNIERRSRSAAAPLCVILVSILVIVISATPAVPSTEVSMVLVFLSIVGLIAGIIMLINAKGKNKYLYVYRPTGSPMKHWSIYIDDNAFRLAKSCFDNRDFSRFTEIKTTSLSSHCLEIYGNDDCYALQLLHYEINNDVCPDCELHVIEGPETKIVSKFLHR